MSMRPDSIRNVSWAVVRDGAEKRHVYRREVDLHLKDGRIVEITPAGARPTGPGETVFDGKGLLALPGLINIHSHPSTEPGSRGVREDHGVPEQQMTGLMERLQAFRLGDDGRQGPAGHPDLKGFGANGRVFFWPLSQLPMFTPQPEHRIAYALAARALNLPSYHDLGEAQIERVVAHVRTAIR